MSDGEGNEGEANERNDESRTKEKQGRHMEREKDKSQNSYMSNETYGPEQGPTDDSDEVSSTTCVTGGLAGAMVALACGANQGVRVTSAGFETRRAGT